MAAPAALLVMGVSGSGKSTVGALLASELGWKFYDADDYHPEENRMKMGQGIPLNDQDRIPWLCSLHDILLRDVASGQHVVLACSALKKAYRDILLRGKGDAPPKCDEPGKEGKRAETRNKTSMGSHVPMMAYTGGWEMLMHCWHETYWVPAREAAIWPAQARFEPFPPQDSATLLATGWLWPESES
ncbi:putative gluconokinase isoform 1-T1 [Molossus nigricans]